MSLTISRAGQVSPLSPPLPYQSDETVVSYFARLSWFHTGKGPARLAADLGLKEMQVHKCQDAALEIIAAASGTELADLERGAFQSQYALTSYAGDLYPLHELRPEIQRICPHCLADDGARDLWRHRISWAFSAAQTCVRHQCRLVDIEGMAFDLRQVLTEAGLDKLCQQSVAASPGRYELWLQDRIAGSAADEPSWLAPQTTQQVLRMLLTLGAVLQYGPAVRLSRMTRDEQHLAREAAFKAAAGGEEALYAALDDIRLQSGLKPGCAGPVGAYGTLNRWLDERSTTSEPGPIKQIVREHILRNSALGIGDKIFGEPVTERRYHSVTTLSEATDIPRRRLCRLLQAIGMVPEGASDAETGAMLFDVEKAERIIRAKETAVPHDELPAYLGASQGQVDVLRKLGVIKPLFAPDRRFQMRKMVFVRDELETLLRKWSCFDVVPARRSADLRPLISACREAPVSMEILLRELSAGRVKAYREPNAFGLSSLCVKLSDISEAKLAA